MKKLTGFMICVIAVGGALYYLYHTLNRTVSDKLPVAVTTPENTRPPNVYHADQKIDSPKTKKIADPPDSVRPADEESLKFERQQNRKIYGQVEMLARKSKLIDLKNVKLADGDQEIRIWNIPDLYSSLTKGYVFKSVGGVWRGMFIFDKNNDGQFKIINYDIPKSGWENWAMFAKAEISTARIAAYRSGLGGNDEAPRVIEVKSGREYAQNISYGSSPDDLLIHHIFSKIKEEFYADRLRWKDY